MAARSNQYIFGEFSADEFLQFFVTPRCYVELPPFNERASSLSQSSGEDYQHIRFGVDDVMSVDGVVKDGLKVCSTLNPQAPEFILGGPGSQRPPHSPRCGSTEPPPASAGRLGPDLAGAPGSLGQRERKKKKKRPPGYYNYLEDEGVGGPGVPGGPGLVNGHALGVTELAPEDMAGEDVGVAAGASAAGVRTCESADESSLDFSSGPGSSSDSNNMASSSSSSSSHSGGGAEGEARTAEPPPPPAESPQSAGSGRQSPAPGPASPPAACSSSSAPAGGDGEERCVSNGPVEPDAVSLDDGQKDSSVIGGAEAPPMATEARSPPPPAVPTATVPKSWASLFHNSKPVPGGPPAYVEVINDPPTVTAAPAPGQTPEGTHQGPGGPVPVSEDPMAPKLAELIENVKLIHKPVSLQPRGLINKGNWCYINATLQALIACPPMYHLMKSIPALNSTQRPGSSTPMLDGFVRLVNEFSNMPLPPKPKQQGAGEKAVKDIRPGVPFEPDYIYRLLTVTKSGLSEKGRQEDAEEYLGCVLNGLQEEMLALKRLLSPQEEQAVTLNGPGAQQDPPGEEEGQDSEDEWEQVGPRNKTSITRQADFVRTPISDIFGGHIRSVVYQQSSKESATLQPFFTLQLDIQAEKVRSLQEALEALVARESVQGYTSKTKQEIEVGRRVTLERLPPVLVLHLKRFVFEKTGGCQKLVKNIDYPIDLEISKDLLSPGVRSRTFRGQRNYRLFAVVYHHGNSATGGHYSTDVFHIGLSGWLRIDDQAVRVIGQYQVVKPAAERSAYLLYYRRVELM